MRQENKRIGQTIKEFRKVKGFSQMELADRIGISYQQVQKYEKGVSNLSIHRLCQVASALDVSVTLFFPTENEVISEALPPYGKLDGDEQLLLHLFREIKNKRKKMAVIAFLTALAE